MAIQPRMGSRQGEVIVCLNEAREVLDGRVDCPRSAPMVSVSDCADCRLLTWRENDRLGALECSTEPA